MYRLLWGHRFSILLGVYLGIELIFEELLDCFPKQLTILQFCQHSQTFLKKLLTGMTLRDGMGREVGGGVPDREHRHTPG